MPKGPVPQLNDLCVFDCTSLWKYIRMVEWTEPPPPPPPPPSSRDVILIILIIPLRWPYYEYDDSNHQRLGCLLNRFFRKKINENIKAPLHWPCERNSPATAEFPAQKASNAEKCFYLMASSWQPLPNKFWRNVCLTTCSICCHICFFCRV